MSKLISFNLPNFFTSINNATSSLLIISLNKNLKRPSKIKSVGALRDIASNVVVANGEIERTVLKPFKLSKKLIPSEI